MASWNGGGNGNAIDRTVNKGRVIFKICPGTVKKVLLNENNNNSSTS